MTALCYKWIHNKSTVTRLLSLCGYQVSINQCEISDVLHIMVTETVTTHAQNHTHTQPVALLCVNTQNLQFAIQILYFRVREKCEVQMLAVSSVSS